MLVLLLCVLVMLCHVVTIRADGVVYVIRVAVLYIGGMVLLVLVVVLVWVMLRVA